MDKTILTVDNLTAAAEAANQSVPIIIEERNGEKHHVKGIIIDAGYREIILFTEGKNILKTDILIEIINNPSKDILINTSRTNISVSGDYKIKIVFGSEDDGLWECIEATSVEVSGEKLILGY